jgi:hypothetical protein
MAYCKRLHIVKPRLQGSTTERNMMERITGWAAYRAGKMPLPPGYELEHGANVLLLRREDGSMVAAFSASGMAPSEVVRQAEKDERTRGKSSA